MRPTDNPCGIKNTSNCLESSSDNDDKQKVINTKNIKNNKKNEGEYKK